MPPPLPPPPSWTKGRSANRSPKECVWRVAESTKERECEARPHREGMCDVRPPREEALFFVDVFLKRLCTYEVSETARAGALNGAEGRSPHALTLQRGRGGKEFHSHYGESFGGLHSNKSHCTIYSHFYCVRILLCPPRRTGWTPASRPPPMQKRGATAISLNSESFGGIGTSTFNGSRSLHSCCFYDIFFVACAMQWVVDSWSVLGSFRKGAVRKRTSSYVKTS